MEKEDVLLKILDKKRKLANERYTKQLIKIQKIKARQYNPFSLAMPFMLDDLSKLIMQYLNVDYCDRHKTIYFKQCIGCLYNGDIRDAEVHDWYWFKLNAVKFNNGKIIGFSKKDYYLQQHLLQMIPNPILFWNTKLEHKKSALDLGIFYDQKGFYKIIICNSVEDEKQDDFCMILNGSQDGTCYLLYDKLYFDFK